MNGVSVTILGVTVIFRVLPSLSSRASAEHRSGSNQKVGSGQVRFDHVRFGSKADMAMDRRNVRFTPESVHRNRPAYYLRRTNSGSLAIFAAIRSALAGCTQGAAPHAKKRREDGTPGEVV